jgi:hypothetical protein
MGERGHIRLYAKASRVENTRRADGSEVLDGRTWLQAGFRAEWGDEAGGLTLQGDLHRVESVDRGFAAGLPIGRAELSGFNVLGRWTRRFAGGSELRVQAYADHARRDERILFQPESDLFDVELQHGFAVGPHELVWGAGYRHGRDDVEDGFLVGYGGVDGGIGCSRRAASSRSARVARSAPSPFRRLRRFRVPGMLTRLARGDQRRVAARDVRGAESRPCLDRIRGQSREAAQAALGFR